MYALDVCVIARNSRRTMKMVRKIKDVSPAKTALIRILFSISLAAGLSAQGQSPDSQSGQWRIAGQNLGNTWSRPALWNFASGGTVIDGPSIVDGTFCWGSG